MNLWPAAWTGLRKAIMAVRPDIPIERIYRVRNVAQLDYKQIEPPYAIIEIPPTPVSVEWGGCCNAAYAPVVSFFVIDNVAGDSDAAMEKTLSALEDWLRAGNLTGGQVLDVNMPDVSINNRINTELAKSEISQIGGAISANILYFQP